MIEGQPVIVEWLDAVRYNGTYPKSDRDFSPDTVRTVGFFMYKDENGAVVVADDSFGGKDQRVRGVHVIPEPMILKVTELEGVGA